MDWKPRNDEAKIEFQKAAMRREEENQRENFGTRDKAVKQTPENVSVRDEEAARCTKRDQDEGDQEASEKIQSRSPGEMQFDTRKDVGNVS